MGKRYTVCILVTGMVRMRRKTKQCICIYASVVFGIFLLSNLLGISSHIGMFNTSLWRHQMGTFSALLALYEGNSPVTGEFPAQRPMTRSFDVFFYVRLNKRLSKQSWSWWFDTPSRSSWRHCNDCEMKTDGCFGKMTHSKASVLLNRGYVLTYLTISFGVILREPGYWHAYSVNQPRRMWVNTLYKHTEA